MRERQSSSTDIPSPLRVIKKGKSMQVLRSPRKFSNESLESGPDQPLMVVKHRKSQRRANVKKSQSSVDTSVFGHGFKEQSRNITGNSASSDTWDPVTPKPRKLPICRRSSSLQVGRPLSPTFLTKLRSLSTRMGPSSKATYRCSSRVLSGSSDDSVFKLSGGPMPTASWEQSSNSGYSEPPSLGEFPRHRFGSGNTLVGVRTPDLTPDPYMLIPHVSITPESKTLDDGQSNIWAAVEISGQLFHPRVDNSTHDSAYSTAGQAPFLPANRSDTELSRYGYLYNVSVDVLPATEGSVIDLIGDTVIRTISPGSSLLILACIEPGTSKSQKPRTPNCDPENLIADLELELGDIQTKYVHVRINYCHSGFPAFRNTLIEDGITNYQTRLETIATGTIKRHNPCSAWSPRQTRMPNPLFAIIASHWGPARASEVMHRIVSNRVNPSRRIPKWTGADVSQIAGNDDTIKLPDRTGRAPPIPQRQASLRQLPPEKISDPARKIWTELRRTSSGNRPAFHVSKANRLPAATTFVDAPNPGPKSRPGSTRPESKSEVQRQRELIRETAVRNRRSIGADSLKSLVPSVAGSTPEGKENSASSSPSPSGGRGLHFDGRKREGRWSLGSWW